MCNMQGFSVANTKKHSLQFPMPILSRHPLVWRHVFHCQKLSNTWTFRSPNDLWPQPFQSQNLWRHIWTSAAAQWCYLVGVMTCVLHWSDLTTTQCFRLTMITSHNLSHFFTWADSLHPVSNHLIKPKHPKVKTRYLLLHKYHYQQKMVTKVLHLSLIQITIQQWFSLPLPDTIALPAASGVHLRRLSVSSSPEGPVHVWMAVPVKMEGWCLFDDAADSCPDDIYADEPKCHYFQEDCETMCNVWWISADAVWVVQWLHIRQLHQPMIQLNAYSMQSDWRTSCRWNVVGLVNGGRMKW